MNWDFQQWLIIGLFASLFFKEEFKTLVLHYFGIKGSDDKLQAGVDYLKFHYNDELSEKLDKMHSDQQVGFKEVHAKQDSMQDCIKRANNKLDNFENYGIKTR